MFTDEKEKKLAEILADVFELNHEGQTACVQYIKGWADKSKHDRVNKKE